MFFAPKTVDGGLFRNTWNHFFLILLPSNIQNLNIHADILVYFPLSSKLNIGLFDRAHLRTILVHFHLWSMVYYIGLFKKYNSRQLITSKILEALCKSLSKTRYLEDRIFYEVHDSIILEYLNLFFILTLVKIRTLYRIFWSVFHYLWNRSFESSIVSIYGLFLSISIYYRCFITLDYSKNILARSPSLR